MEPGVPALYVRGNADREVAQGVTGAAGDWVAEVTAWCRSRLDDRHASFLLEQSETVTIAVEGLGDVLFCHGSPRGDEESLTPLTPDERLTEALAGASADVVVCGHTHMQFDRTTGDVRVVNAGSVGMPYEGRPGAYWLLLDGDVSLRRTDYAYASASAAVASSGCPYATEFAADVLAPPERDATARRFEGLPSA
jgi:predicted phosphodiesterase